MKKLITLTLTACLVFTAGAWVGGQGTYGDWATATKWAQEQGLFNVQGDRYWQGNVDRGGAGAGALEVVSES